MIYYFAYGSNMNHTRMLERVGEFSIIGRGVLNDFRLAFNKKAQGKVGEAYANVMPSSGDYVEGIVYQFDEIQKLDKPEGYPNHYDRKLMTISIGGEPTEAWVYFAREDRIAEGLMPSKEYLEHLLQGREYLSEGYWQHLEDIKIKLEKTQ
jgi:gamma-glutamylcyclotransferase